MIRSIAVALDGSDHSIAALAAAVALAKPGRAELRPVFVDDREAQRRILVEAIPATALDPGFRPDLSSSLIQMEKTIREAAARAREQVREMTRGRFKLRVLEGNPVDILLDESMSADIMAMGRSGFSPATGPVKLGRVTRAVVRGSPCPVLAARDGSVVGAPFLVPYSGSSQSNRALRLSAMLAGAFRARVEVVVVHDKAEEARRLVEEARRFLSPHKLQAGFTRRKGAPADAVAELARSKNAGLIVMGAYGRGTLAGLLLGSTTEKVVEKTLCAAILCT